MAVSCGDGISVVAADGSSDAARMVTVAQSTGRDGGRTRQPIAAAGYSFLVFQLDFYTSRDAPERRTERDSGTRTDTCPSASFVRHLAGRAVLCRLLV